MSSPPTGRRPTVAIGVDVGGTKTAVGLVRVADGELMAQQVLATCAGDGAEQLRQRVQACVAQLRGHPVVPPGAASDVPVGVALPELVAPDGAVLTDVVVPGITGDLSERWREVGVTVVAADVRAAARAEAELGHGRGLASFGYVSVGTGISSCLVIDGRPWPGQHGAAILLGSGILVDGPAGPLTTLEDLAGGPGLLAALRAAGGSADSTQELLALADGDPLAGRVVAEAGAALGRGIAELVNLVDPAAVVVGGGLGCAAGRYWDSVEPAARAAIWAEVSRDVPIRQAATGPAAGMLGAALLAARTQS